MRDSFLQFNVDQSAEEIFWLESLRKDSWEVYLDQIVYGEKGFKSIQSY